MAQYKQEKPPIKAIDAQDPDQFTCYGTCFLGHPPKYGESYSAQRMLKAKLVPAKQPIENTLKSRVIPTLDSLLTNPIGAVITHAQEWWDSLDKEYSPIPDATASNPSSKR